MIYIITIVACWILLRKPGNPLFGSHLGQNPASGSHPFRSVVDWPRPRPITDVAAVLIRHDSLRPCFEHQFWQDHFPLVTAEQVAIVLVPIFAPSIQDAGRDHAGA